MNQVPVVPETNISSSRKSTLRQSRKLQIIHSSTTQERVQGSEQSILCATEASFRNYTNAADCPYFRAAIFLLSQREINPRQVKTLTNLRIKKLKKIYRTQAELRKAFKDGHFQLRTTKDPSDNKNVSNLSIHAMNRSRDNCGRFGKGSNNNLYTCCGDSLTIGRRDDISTADISQIENSSDLRFLIDQYLTRRKSSDNEEKFGSGYQDTFGKETTPVCHTLFKGNQPDPHFDTISPRPSLCKNNSSLKVKENSTDSPENRHIGSPYDYFQTDEPPSLWEHLYFMP